jgi:hypothetical protein
MRDVDSACGSAPMLDSQNFGQDRSPEPHPHTLPCNRRRLIAGTGTRRWPALTPPPPASVPLHGRSGQRCSAHTKYSENEFLVDDGMSEALFQSSAVPSHVLPAFCLQLRARAPPSINTPLNLRLPPTTRIPLFEAHIVLIASFTRPYSYPQTCLILGLRASAKAS